MVATLREVLSHLSLDNSTETESSALGRSSGEDRRSSDRRRNTGPFQHGDVRLGFAAQAAGLGTYYLNCTTGDSLWSPELKAIAGLPVDQIPLSTEEAETLIHPEDRPSFFQKLLASLDPTGVGEFEDEHRLLRLDGSVAWVKTKGRTFFVGEGESRRPLWASGVVMEIAPDSTYTPRNVTETKEELADLVESAIEGLITIDTDQRIIRFNPAASRMLHCPTHEALGSHLERFIPERYRAKHRDGVRRFAEGSIPPHFLGKVGEFVALRTDGQEFPFEASIARVMVGGDCHMTIFMRDITDRVEAERALRRSTEYLELAVRGANIGIWAWNQKTGEVMLSPRCYEIYGIPVGEPMSFERFLKTVRSCDTERFQTALKASMEDGKDFNMERQVAWPDGSLHWVATIGRHLSDDDGNPLGMRGILINVDERKRLEELLVDRNRMLESAVEERTAQLKQANEGLERSNLELQQFAFIAAHDLQSPLRSISGFAHLLKKEYAGRFDTQADQWLDHLVRSAQRLHNVIHDILAYSRVDSRGSAFSQADLNEIFDAVLGVLDEPIREGGAIVTRDDLPTVRGDRSQLAQLFQNLLDNAIKYHGEKVPQVHVSARREGPEWVFSIRDNGIGIAKKHLDSIFEIFRRLHGQDTYPGTGIGLAICRRVVVRHGGRIWAESEPGQGSTFFFTLPAE